MDESEAQVLRRHGSAVGVCLDRLAIDAACFCFSASKSPWPSWGSPLPRNGLSIIMGGTSLGAGDRRGLPLETRDGE